MANQLAMDKVQSIKSLRATGMSQRRIAKTLGISRKAVRRHLEPIPPKDTKAPTGEAPTGSSGGESPKDTKAPTGSECPPEPAGRRCRSLCGAYRETILAKLEQGPDGAADSTRICSRSTAFPASTVRCGGSWSNSLSGRNCRSAASRSNRATRCKWTTARAPAARRRTGSCTGLTSFARC